LKKKNYTCRWGPCSKRDNCYMADVLAWPSDLYETVDYQQIVMSDIIVEHYSYPQPSRISKMYGWGMSLLQKLPVVHRFVKPKDDPFELAKVRMNWLLMAKLKDLKSKKEFVVSVMHMPCNYLCPDSILLFADVAFASLNNFAGEIVPTLMMGDFNILPNSLVYNFITDKTKREHVPLGWTYLLNEEWSSAYVLSHGEEPEYTTYAHIPGKHGEEPFKGTLDYIFVRKNLLPRNVVFPTVPDESIKDRLVPINENPSDHLPLFAELEWD